MNNLDFNLSSPDISPAIKLHLSFHLRLLGFGSDRLPDWIGKPFGSTIFSNRGEFVYLLAPTLELWTLVLSHRTQILYIADISFVIMYLEVVPGCLVLESGTGSGSLTTLLQGLWLQRDVYTFDFHEQRAVSAREDFERTGISALVTVLAFRDIALQAPTHILIIPKSKDGLTGLSKLPRLCFMIGSMGSGNCASKCKDKSPKLIKNSDKVCTDKTNRVIIDPSATTRQGNKESSLGPITPDANRECDSDGSKTPPSAPCLNGVSDTCPGAPIKLTGRSRVTDLGFCRKLEF
ncbi:hypothetical protein J1N35_032924 [Gossypium stocksii]|uniref:tRNA (adenine(58)-N(1))-methyltransferase n=1 Tax=Gossypium stocksii TaxID=47602 RepID=A0A9D3UR16_9ROSI|nr:hypothetical protein J1N35_032924 [Gossypium stocksii]